VGWLDAFAEIPRDAPLPSLIQMLRFGEDSDLETAPDGIGREGRKLAGTVPTKLDHKDCTLLVFKRAAPTEQGGLHYADHRHCSATL